MVLAAVHSELASKQRRARNVVVHGLQPMNDIHDADNFLSVCEENLPIKPAIVRCRRLGKQPQPGVIQPLLLVLRDESSASELLRCAPQLRRSGNPAVSNLYINPDRTPAEALAAYNDRVQRRQRRQASQQMQSTGTEGTLAVTAPSFVPAAEQE